MYLAEDYAFPYSAIFCFRYYYKLLFFNILFPMWLYVAGIYYNNLLFYAAFFLFKWFIVYQYLDILASFFVYIVF
ncbi:hypothetical protein HMPREF9144_0448 [Prevotella pallens ATCC 700821]|uniref:Uncharacterized protein n=2 Tax=Prevotella pallens TaxID=60133 RepID=A0ABX9DTF0_9BACT|nr:hypothetical protein HMPREF9144_0448 [Prevotella pallens ATCC 700821]RAS45739.1 hypothetical protein BC673_10941 [Prevotella pallens]